MVTIGMSYKVLQGKEETFEKACTGIIEAMNGINGHEKSFLYKDVNDGQSYLIASEWRSEDAFNTFCQSDKFKQVISWGKESILDGRPSQSTIKSCTKWLNKNGETDIDGFDFKKLTCLDKGNDVIRIGTRTNDDEDSDEPGHFLLRKNLALNYIELVKDEKFNLYFDHDYNQAQSSSNVYLAHLHWTKQLLKGIFFAELGKSGCKVVDVGCGKGEFVDLLNTDSYFDCYGFDTSNSGENPKIQSRYLIQDDRDDEVDLIVLKYVLDYVSPPSILLRSLKDIFPNAYIYIEGPLIENTLQKGHFFDINFEQANYFSKDSYLDFFDGKVLRCGTVFGGEYQYVIARIRNLNSNLNIEYENSEWSLIEMNELFPLMAERIAETHKSIRDDGRIWVWGAGRKGTMFLYYLAQSTILKSDRLGCVDQDLRKQGKYTPYTKVPIISNASLIDRIKVDDIVVILNSNYSNEIRDFLAIHLSFSVNIMEF